jgi:hypothetical protein
MLKHVDKSPERVTKYPLLTEKDAAEYERIRSGIINVLETMGGYEPAIDDLPIEQIARTTIYLRKIESFVDAPQATSDTYSSVTDSKLKMAKMIENAIRQLALGRRDRLGRQAQSSLENELKEATLRAVKKNAEQ